MKEPLRQYLEIKAQNPGTLLLFRVGDFYELFYEDARLASKIVGLTLTTMEKNAKEPVPMCGFPYHQANNYIQVLVHAGHRVAVCEQVKDDKPPAGRSVTRIVTPGSLIET